MAGSIPGSRDKTMNTAKFLLSKVTVKQRTATILGLRGMEPLQRGEGTHFCLRANRKDEE